ncbi:hypothetical protein [Streptomyces sp. HC307]|uniref:hypothetical protein n=1 Tax=Streptomyces flavusporus TaxID=3385496 RepID=UPI003916EF73
MKKQRTSSPLGLTAALLRIGRSAARGAESGRLRLVALCVATFALAMSFAACAVVAATYEGREKAQVARSPQVVPENQKDKAIARWLESSDTINGAQYTVIYIEPLTDDAPPPPGLRRWPAPGHSALSFGAEVAGLTEGITSRFGEIDNRIQPEGLASDAEPLIYARPAESLTEGFYVSAWGNEEGVVFGEPLTIQPAKSFYILITVTWLAPAAALTVIAARTGSAMRDRRRAVLHAIGTGPRHRLLIDLGEAGPPILVGAALATLTIWLYQGTSWPLPKVNYVMTASYLEPYLGILYSCVGLAALVVAVAAMFLQPRATAAGSTRPRQRQQRALLRSATWLCPLAFAFAFIGPSLLGAKDNELLFLLPYSMGALTALILLPAALATLTIRFGQALAWWGRRSRRPAPLLGGRWIAASPAAIARVITSIVLLMGISAQLYTWNNRVTESDLAAKQVQEALGSSVVRVEGVDRNSVKRLHTFIDALPSDTEVVGVYIGSVPGQQVGTQVVGSRAAIEMAGFSAPAGSEAAPLAAGDATSARGRALLKGLSMTGDSSIAARAGEIDTVENLVSLQVIAPAGSRLAESEIKQVANNKLLPGWRASVPGTEWTATLATYQEHSWWLPLFALGTIAILAFATCLANMGEFLRFARSLAPITVITGSRRPFVSTTLLVFLGAFGIALTLGAAAAVLLTVPMLGAPVHANGLPTTLVITSILIVGAIALVMTLWATRVALRESGRWRPTAE